MKTMKVWMGGCWVACLLLTSSALAFDLQGHRGARGLAPENTLPAFARALSLGVTALELDTAITKDGVVVISHDPSLNPDITRDKFGKWLEKPGPAIHSLTFDELQQFDVGRLKPYTNYAKLFPEQKAVDGTRIPKLADLFALSKKSGNDQVRFNIEIKVSPLKPSETLDPETSAKMVVEMIRKEAMEARVSILSFDWRTLQAVQKIAPEIPTVYISIQQRAFDTIAADNPGGSPWTAGFQHKNHGSVPRMVKAAGGRTWSPYFGDLTEAKLKEAHDLGIKVVVWTVNEPAQIKKMLDLGVDGIISDRPDLVRQVMAERGMALPPATPVQP
ncbi:MAG: glycerophosphodiester phosphodiesterase [Thermodesulfobacteriota bacterium]|jgi:glycerophosphoryl diester phosphodiesterase